MWTGFVYVMAWIEFWMYCTGRFNPLLWIEEGLPRLTVSHFFWWAAAILMGVAGGWASRWRFRSLLGLIVLVFLGLVIFTQVVLVPNRRMNLSDDPVRGFRLERLGPAGDQTEVYLLSFDYEKQNDFAVHLYDCDSDDAKPYDDVNTSFMGQSLKALINKLEYRTRSAHRQLLGTINGGFFGESGFSVAHHEEPVVENGRVLYNVDLLQPKEQGWFFAINSSARVLAGSPRFSMLPSIPWDGLGNYQTVLGGVRPLRFEGNSVLLKPGAGATTLKCSRTSVGWSADGKKFYILIVHDPDSEGASQFQRKMHWPHAGGWDVRDVHKFWEKEDVPFALLFDGGESTQLAYRQDQGFQYVPSGYEYSYTLGYLFQRPLLVNLPILPPSEGHRGVLNYLYVDAPAPR
jgi:Phosphodiester glycosidase